MNSLLRAALASGALFFSLASSATAQVRATVRDTVPGDTVPGDTASADSADVARRSDPVADSVIALLRTLRGFTITEYEGERAIYRADEGVLRLTGEAAVDREGNRLTADSIVFRDRTDLVEAYGNPAVTGEAQELTGDTLYYDLARRRATALGARTKVTDQATWIVTGDVTLEGTEAVYASHGRFTTCDLEIPHYHFESDRIKIVRDKYIVARPARLYFGKVPVMVLPFVVQNLEKGRRSGLVVPRFSLNDIIRTNANYTREISDVGWYWAINDYVGAQVTGTWRSESYTALQGSTDFRWRRQFLDGSATFQRYWREDGQKELNLNASTRWEPDERTDLTFQGRYASSSEFIRESTYDPRETTQDLASTLAVSRRFDWGNVGFGAERRQSIGDGSVDMVLPRLNVSPQPLTFFRAPSEDVARWYSNTTLTWGFNGTRTSTQGKGDVLRGIQDRAVTNLSGGLQSLTIGKLNITSNATLNQTKLQALAGNDSIGDLMARDSSQAAWQASIGYQQRLVGQTILTPTIQLSQDYARQSTTDEQFLGSPVRMSAGASLSTAIFGFYPGVGPFSTIRHRLSPSVSYGYSPEMQQTTLQDEVFGVRRGNAQNRISLGINQTFEAKLRPRNVEQTPSIGDTLLADSTGTTDRESEPSDPQKVTLLSLSTSPFEYDFVRAAKEGNGFVTERVSNSITSDYLRGLTIQMEHDLFDRTNLDPNDAATRGNLGTFAPRLSQLSTSFELGPTSSVMLLISRLLGRPDEDLQNPATQGQFPGAPPESGTIEPTGAATNNPQGTGSGPWNVGFRYSFTRPSRNFIPRLEDTDRPRFVPDDRALQTLGIDARFALTPAWGVSWGTDYSITDREFGTHNLRFTRDLHRWQANFNFYKTPTGNSAFEFYVELIDNRELKLDYREQNLGIDRRQE